MDLFSDLYDELSTLIEEKLPEVQHIDLWHEQTENLGEEIPFPTPAVFIELNVVDTSTQGRRAQILNVSVKFHVFVETFSESYQGSITKRDSLDVLRIIGALHGFLQGQGGCNYASMNRTGQGKENAVDAGIQYQITFETTCQDDSACIKYESISNPNADVSILKKSD